MEAAAAMDFHTLSRRELQALCKRNGVRANMTNAAMAEALQGLNSVDGIDEIGTTLCLPTPGRSAMKSAARMVPVEEQQHGSPLPRGRRVSVKSPEAIRMEVEGGEGEVKEIVKTPGVALRSTRRGTRATPAPLPTPVPASSTRAAARRTAARKTVEVVPTPATRRRQRTASRKTAEAVEPDRPAEDVSEEKTSEITMAMNLEAEVVATASKEQQDELEAAISEVKYDDTKEKVQQEDQEGEVVAAASTEEKMQQDELKAAILNVKSDEPKEEKVQQGEPNAVALDVKCDELEEEVVQQEEPNDVALDVKCYEPEEEVGKFLEGNNKEEEQEGEEGIVKKQEPISVERSAPLTVKDDSPILGVIEKQQDASVQDCENLAELSLANEMADEIISVTEEKEVAISEEDVTEDKEVTIDEEAAAKVLQGELTYNEISKEDDFDEDEELASDDEKNTTEIGSTGESDEDTNEAAGKMLHGELTYDESSEEEEEDDETNTEEIGSIGESNEDTDETKEESYAVPVLQGNGKAEEANEDACTDDDDFSGDLPPEFDNIMIFSDAKTESDIAPPVLEEIQVAVASATKAAKSLDESAMNAELEEGPEEADATEKAMKEVDNIVKSLDEFTFQEGESEEMQQQQPQDYNSMSLRKLKSTYKKCLVAAKEGKQGEFTEGKRLPLEEVDENASIEH